MRMKFSVYTGQVPAYLNGIWSSGSSAAIFRGQQNSVTDDRGDIGAAEHGHGAADLGVENLQRPRRAGFAGCGCAEERRPPNHDGISAECERLQHVAAASKAAVDNHRYPLADRRDHRGKRIDRCQRGIAGDTAVIETITASTPRSAAIAASKDAGHP